LDNWDGQVSVLYNSSTSSLTKGSTKLGRFSSAKKLLTSLTCVSKGGTFLKE
jgi:hypothetical protein